MLIKKKQKPSNTAKDKNKSKSSNVNHFGDCCLKSLSVCTAEWPAWTHGHCNHLNIADSKIIKFILPGKHYQ